MAQEKKVEAAENIAAEAEQTATEREGVITLNTPYLFEGKEPVRIRLINSGKLIGTTAALHPAFVRAMRELLGDENVVLK